MSWIPVMLAVGLLGTVQASHHGCQRGLRPNATERLRLYGDIPYIHTIESSNRTGAVNASRVQRLFNLGLLLAAGYNQAEARRTFRAALELDPLCAMCWWGVAYARGPFQNKVVLKKPDDDGDVDMYYSDDDVRNAVRAIRYAAALAGLLFHNTTEAAMTAIAAQLKTHVDSGGVSDGGDGGSGAVKRLTERLPSCRRQAAPGPAAAPGPEAGKGMGTGHGRRRWRQLLVSHDGTAAAESGSKVSAPAGASRSSRQQLLRKEQYYIAAMFDRLSAGVTSGRLWAAAERRFARDMQEVAACFPHDADALALAAEALANLSPWDFVVNGTVAADLPRNLTKEVVGLLQEALQRNASQPLALHLMIHVTEELPARNTSSSSSTTTPEYVAGLALPAATRLLGAFPRLDHLQHMPSHTFVRLGMWQQALQSNVLALSASASASWACLSPLYPDHNAAMAVFAASMAANYPAAQVYGRVLRELPRLLPDTDTSLARLWPAALLVEILYGNWTLVGAAPPPPVDSAADRAALSELRSHLDASLNAVVKGSAAAAAGAGGSSPWATDVLDHPALDAGVRSAVLEGHAARPGSEGGGGGGGGEAGNGESKRPKRWTDADYSLKLALGPKDRSGPKFAVLVWLYGQIMVLANQLHEDQIAAGDGAHARLPPPPSSSAAVPLGQQTDAQANALADLVVAALSGGGGGSAAAAKRDEDSLLLDQLLEKMRNTWAGMEVEQPVPPGPGLGVSVPGYQLMGEVLYKMADARVAFARGNITAALQSLREAVAKEDAAGFNEPPRLAQQPARQCLGWLQYHHRMFKDAAETYLADLSRYPNNAWSLLGVQMIWEQLQTPRLEGMSVEEQADTLRALSPAASRPVSGVGYTLRSSCPAFAVTTKERR